jgi:hypothetical protein
MTLPPIIPDSLGSVSTCNLIGINSKDERLAFGLHLPAELIDVTLACPDGAEGDTFGVVFLGDLGDGNRVLMDIQTAVKRARLAHG